MIKFFLFFSFLFTLVSCSESIQETSKVKIRIPALSKSIAQAVTPSSLSELNCFSVFVSYPEGSAGICSKPDSSTLTVATFSGFVGSGENIVLEVDSGFNRTFTILGMSTSGTCPSITNFDTTSTDHSPLYVLGEEIVSISGETQTVDINISYSSSRYLLTCEGSIFNWTTGSIWDSSTWDEATWGD